ncbi:MAG: ABC transporter ATP-binding protein [Pseudomonadota bacterium]|nr:ABC transporter ATP-binding protein [Pseudomonadota bacterium]
MKQLVRDIWTILTPHQRQRFLILQVLMIVSAFFELFSLSLIAPFIAVLSNPSLFYTQPVLAFVFDLLGFSTQSAFIITFGAFILLFLLVSSCVAMLNVWFQARFANNVGVKLGDKLFSHYLYQNWLFHTQHSSSTLTKQIATEADRVTFGVLQPFMWMCAKSILALVLIIAIICVNPFIAFFGIGVFVLAYFLFYRVLRSVLRRGGEAISLANVQRYQIMNNTFGGIKEVMLLQRQPYFEKRFANAGQNLASSRGRNTALGMMPRYFIELMAFSVMILFLLVFFVVKGADIITILPMASLYAVAGIKILPALQQVYSSASQIQGNRSALDKILDDLDIINETHLVTQQPDIEFSRQIEFCDVGFSYPEADKPVFSGLNLTIKKGQQVGIKGKTGSGKSTVLDLLMGLIEPNTGQIKVDGVSLNRSNYQAWQKKIALVSQDIFLIEGSLAQNITFGLETHDIDQPKVARCIEAAALAETVADLPYGLDTWVGERGVKLSGGQKQRVAIARALYHDSEVLIFDEATSALDTETESDVMRAINALGDKTIIMVAHRLDTLANSDLTINLQ